MGITMTESAAKHIQKQVEKSDRGIGLRLGVKKSGCSGFAYTFDIAESVLETDRVFENFGVKVLVDEQNMQYLEGTQLDYVKEGFAHVFKFNNPNVKNECGCGESFAV
jgi:iron-sulfur cluster assembly protein